MIWPLCPKAMPESFRKAVSGVTPMADTTKSPVTTLPLPRTTLILSSTSLNSQTPSLRYREIPRSISSFSTIMDISESKGARIWGAASTRDTLRPLSRRFSAVSTPMNPPPMTMASPFRSSSAAFLILSISLMSLRDMTFSESMPMMPGFSGFAPGEMTR